MKVPNHEMVVTLHKMNRAIASLLLVVIGQLLLPWAAAYHAPKKTQVYIRSRDNKDTYVQLATGVCWKDSNENKWQDPWEILATVDIETPRRGGELQSGVETSCQIVLGVAYVENDAPWTNRAMRTYEVHQRLSDVEWDWDRVEMCIGIVKSFRKVGANRHSPLHEACWWQ